MSIEMFEELTNDQLKTECKEMGVTIKAKNPNKPNKAELLASIESHLNYGADAAVEDEVKKPEAPKAVVKKVQTPQQLARLDMFRKDRVIVHDVQENQTKDKDELLPISWGNRLLGGQTDFVSLNGLPQYIRRGAINNLLEATTTIQQPGKNGMGVVTEKVKRFVVTEVAGMSEEELAELGNKQRMRNSKYA